MIEVFVWGGIIINKSESVWYTHTPYIKGEREKQQHPSTLSSTTHDIVASYFVCGTKKHVFFLVETKNYYCATFSEKSETNTTTFKNEENKKRISLNVLYTHIYIRKEGYIVVERWFVSIWVKDLKRRVDEANVEENRLRLRLQHQSWIERQWHMWLLNDHQQRSHFNPSRKMCVMWEDAMRIIFCSSAIGVWNLTAWNTWTITRIASWDFPRSRVQFVVRILRSPEGKRVKMSLKSIFPRRIERRRKIPHHHQQNNHHTSRTNGWFDCITPRMQCLWSNMMAWVCLLCLDTVLWESFENSSSKTRLRSTTSTIHITCGPRGVHRPFTKWSHPLRVWCKWVRSKACRGVFIFVVLDGFNLVWIPCKVLQLRDSPSNCFSRWITPCFWHTWTPSGEILPRNSTRGSRPFVCSTPRWRWSR